MSIAFLKKHEVAVVGVLVVIALVFRLYRVSNPLLDWHAWRQADTASVTRQYQKNGITPLRPTFLDLSSTPSGTDNPNGYRMVEFPLISIMVAGVLQPFGITTLPQLELASRLFAIMFSVGGVVALYVLVRSISGRSVAVASTLVYSILPFSFYYGRTTLPEPVLIGSVLISLAAFHLWLVNSKKRWYFISLVFLLISYLLKPYTIFFVPVYAALAFNRYSWKALLNPWIWLMAIVTPLPMLWWRSWITQFPEGIPGSSWLYNGNEIRFKPAWFRWLFFERLNRLISGTLGMIFIFANLLAVSRKEVLVYGAWWLGMLTYLAVFATGNVQHDYYQASLIPIVSISIGRGMIALVRVLSSGKTTFWKLGVFIAAISTLILYGSTLAFGWQLSGYFPEKIVKEFVWMVLVSGSVIVLLIAAKFGKRLPMALNFGIVTAIFIGSWLFSWQYVSGYFNVNHWHYVRAGQAVQQVAQADDLVIAPGFGDTQLLFQTDRRGWPIGGSIDQKIAAGADWYVSPDQDDETKTLMTRFATERITDEFVLINLNQPKQ